MHLLRRIEQGIDAVVRRVAFVALAGMIITITLQILFRVLFDALVWSEEVARYLLVWTTFLGATLAYQRGRHIAVSALVDLIPGWPRKVIRLIAKAAAIIFFIVVILAGFRYMGRQGAQVSASLRIPMPYIYVVIPVSAILMLYSALIDTLELVTGKPASGSDPGAGEEPMDGAGPNAGSGGPSGATPPADPGSGGGS